MKPTLFILALLAISLYVSAQEQHVAHWGYDGEVGPDHWGESAPDFATCRMGRHQSPIDIRKIIPSDLPPITFDYKASPLKIIDNGHTIQVNYAPGSWITVGSKRYQLLQFHFHHPSEERVQGKAHQMVIHLVHSDDIGNKAVVAVLLDSGKDNQVLQTVFGHMPSRKGTEESSDLTINATDLLPKKLGYYTFTGSLTTPPCTEGVTWFVLSTPMTVDASELRSFVKLYPHNARPTQPLNDRTVRATR